MARIPVQIGRRQLETGGVVQYPSGSPVGQALEGSGDRLVALADRFRDQQERADAFKLKVAQQNFDLDLAGQLEAQQPAVDGSGFHDAFVGQMTPEGTVQKPGIFDDRAKVYRDQLPEGVRGQFDQATDLLRKEYSNKAAVKQRSTQQAFYRIQVGKMLANLENSVAQTDPGDEAAYQHYRAKGLDFIEATGLSDTEKLALEVKWTNDAAKASWLALHERNPQAALDALGIGPAPKGASGSLVDRIIGAESAGNATAKNPRSSATGLGQFTSSTWLGVIKRHAPELLEGKSRAQVLALRNDPQISRRMTQALLEDNSQALQERGLPVTDGSLYLAHFAGAEGAADILKAIQAGQGERSAASVLGAKVAAANPFMASMTAQDLADWASRKVGQGAGGKTRIVNPRFADLTIEQRFQLANQAEGTLKAAYKMETDTLKEQRRGITKDGYDLMRDDKLTEEWVEENRDILNVTDYKAFSKALMPETQIKSTPPKEYLRLLDLADKDPALAITEARDLYANNVIAKEVFNTVRSRAEKNSTSRDFSDELRQYVSTALTPERDAPQSHYARKLDALFQYDDWLENNKGADRETIRKQAQAIIDDYRTIRYASGVTSLPLPRFTSATPETFDQAEIEKVKAKIVQNLRDGSLSKRDAAEQAALVRRWSELLKYRD